MQLILVALNLHLEILDRQLEVDFLRRQLPRFLIDFLLVDHVLLYVLADLVLLGRIVVLHQDVNQPL